MATHPMTGDRIARTVDDQFIALICSDEQLLRAEFDAIIAGQWPSPPPGTPAHGAVGHRETAADSRPAACPGGRLMTSRHPDVDGWVRERSPPVPADTQLRIAMRRQVIAHT
jgi:hypothetical protein